jgi:hypothetical protein
MGLKKPIEYVIPVTVSNGDTNAQSSAQLPPGKIKCVTAFFRDYSAIQAGYVRSAIQDSNGEDVSKMQSIENYATRQGGNYYDSKKPLPMDAGQLVTITVLATAAFTGDFLVDYVFVYEPEENC